MTTWLLKSCNCVSKVGVANQVGMVSQVGVVNQVGMVTQVGVANQVGVVSQVGVALPDSPHVLPCTSSE